VSKNNFTPEKNVEIMEFTSYWKPFHVTIESNITFPDLHGKVWPVKNYIKTNVRVRGMLHVKQLFKDIWLICAEVVSKSTNIRGFFRFIILENLILVENDEEGINFTIFQEYLCPLLKINKVKEIRVNAMRIRSLAKKGTPTRLTLLVNNQTAGVDGLDRITLTGENIVRGIQTLQDRQEVDLKADSVGPWIEVETKELEYRMGKGVFVKETSTTTFEMIKATLS
jgi:hypothetical protein